MVRSLPVLVLVTLLPATLIGCRDSFVNAPQTNVTAAGVLAPAPGVGPTEVYPIGEGGGNETRVTAEFWRDSLEINIHRERSLVGTQFQAMVNADLQPTGYGDGYDYVLRGLEAAADGSFPVRLGDPLNDENPGGWGDIVGTGLSTENGRRLRIRVAQATLGGTSAARLQVQLMREGAMVFEWTGGVGTLQNGIARLALGPRAPGSRLPRSR